jgi:hypothetical protein
VGALASQLTNDGLALDQTPQEGRGLGPASLLPDIEATGFKLGCRDALQTDRDAFDDDGVAVQDMRTPA